MEIRELSLKDIPAVRAFTDQSIGRNYFSESELSEIFNKSSAQGLMCSFVLADKDKIYGLRLAYPPGSWTKGKGKKLRPDLWQVPPEKVAYFQSLFIAKEFQGQAWGPKLSAASIAVFKKLGAKAIVTHAWKESPNNSSIRYLTKQGFQSIATHPEYWIDVDYECVLDGKPCRCTSEEMILYFPQDNL